MIMLLYKKRINYMKNNYISVIAILVFSSVLGYGANPERLNDTNTVNKKDPELKNIKPLQRDYVANVFQWESLKVHQKMIDSSDHSYVLKKAPENMLLRENGDLSWTPAPSMEGKTFNVLVDYKKGGKDRSLHFNVRVAKTEPLKYDVKKRVLVINDSNCKSPLGKSMNFNLLFLDEENSSIALHDCDNNFDYHKLTHNNVNLKKIDIRKVVSNVNFHVPDNIEAMSCFFSMGEEHVLSADMYSHKRRNDFSVFLVDSPPELSIYKFKPFNIRTHHPRSSKNEWSFPYLDAANGLYFIGKEK